VLGSVPHWILQWGITVLAIVVVILLAGSTLVKYPDVIPAQIVLTGTTPPAVIVAHASGKLKELFVADNQNVKVGDYLAVIDNPAQTEDVISLKSAMTLGTLQSSYSAFRSALHEYTEYRRLMYYPQNAWQSHVSGCSFGKGETGVKSKHPFAEFSRK
jgi:HlyD family secretion protein